MDAIPAYLIAHFAKSHLWHASTLLFGFFLTEACAIEARSMGRIMAASLLLNALIDLGLGIWWRDRLVRTAHALRLQARGAPLTCGFFVLFCGTPFLPPDLRIAWSLATLFGFRIGYPLLDVPQNTIAVMLPTSDGARCTLLAQRNMASGLAGIAVSAVAAPMLIHGAALTTWVVWASCLAGFVCGSAWWLARAETEVNAGSAEASHDSGSNLSFRTILCALAVATFACAAFRTIEPYHGAFVSGGAGLPLWAAIGGTVSQPLWLLCRRRWSMAGTLVVAAGALSLSAMVLLGALRTSPAGAMLAGLGFGTGSGGVWLMLWTAMTTQAARCKATRHVGAFTCVSKLSQSAAVLLTGHVLAASPYRLTMRDPFSPPTLMMAGALTTIAIVCLALAFCYRINRTAYDGRSATRHRAVRTIRVPD